MIKNVTKQSCVATAEEEVWNMHQLVCILANVDPF